MANGNTQEVTGWVGWIAFAGVMMLLAGMFQAVAGIVALSKDEIISTSGLLVFDITGWGWAHLVLGIALIFAAFSVFAGGTFGRVIGVLVALISAVANLAFVPAYPFWALTIIFVDILIIHALTAHGSELKA